MITVIAIGKKHEAWITQGIERYEKRLRAPWNIKWVLLPHSHFDGDRARQEESERIMSRLTPRDYVVLLDERGHMFDSPGISEMVEEQINESNQVVFIIGGAYGVSEELYSRTTAFRSDAIWSLSKLVFPHQLVRLMLIEQLYRAQTIARGGSYHHE